MSTEIEKYRKLKRWSRHIVGQITPPDVDRVLSSASVWEGGITRSDILDRIEKFRSCCTVLEVRSRAPDVARLLQEHITVHNANFCHQYLVCPICASRVQNRRRARFGEHIKRMRQQYRNAYLLTFTVKDGGNLSERLGMLKNSLARFRLKGQRRKRKRSFGEWGKVLAGIMAFEIKRGRNSKEWHPHAHALVFTNDGIDYQLYDPAQREEIQRLVSKPTPGDLSLAVPTENWRELGGYLVPVSKLTSEWYDSTFGESVNVDVTKVRGGPQEAYTKAANEVLKYISKLEGQSPTDVVEVLRDTYNKRNLATYGALRVGPDEEQDIDITDWVQGPEEDEENIFAVMWGEKEDSYASVKRAHRPLFDDSLSTDRARSFLSRQAKMLGMYRMDRRSLVEHYGLEHPDLARKLNRLKAAFRNSVQVLWTGYRSRFEKQEARGLMPPVQQDLFATPI